MASESHVPWTRKEFEIQRAAAGAVVRREGLPLAIVSVVLGVAQVVFLRWADVHLDRSTKLSIEVPVFLSYLVIVGGLLWRYIHRVKAARPKCPQCGIHLTELSERVAVATGRCDSCGGQILN